MASTVRRRRLTAGGVIKVRRLIIEVLLFLRNLLTLRRVRLRMGTTASAERNVSKRVPPRYRGLLQELRHDLKTAYPGLEKRARAVRHDLSEPTLCRYLEAAYWSLTCGGEAIAAQLAATVAWREAYGAYRIPDADARAADAGGAGVFFVRGRDRSGRPVVYINPARLAPGQSADDTIQALVYTLERATRALPPGVEEITFVVDCRGFGLGRLPPVGFLKKAFQLLMAHYPMRIGHIVMANAGPSVQLVWHVVAPLVTERTKRKMFFLHPTVAPPAAPTVAGPVGGGGAAALTGGSGGGGGSGGCFGAVAGGAAADAGATDASFAAGKAARAAKTLARFVAPEQLLAEHGGADRWTFDPDTYYREGWRW
ncbi:unnamed protein product [Phaeothamnion confervicola]